MLVWIFIAIVTWYGPGFEGTLTASGTIFDSSEMTAACHPSLLGSQLIVINRETNRGVLVTCADTGPYDWRGGWVHKGIEYIDLSQAAFEAIAPLSQGVIRAEVIVLPP
jgi:rare lipoprotein A